MEGENDHSEENNLAVHISSSSSLATPSLVFICRPHKLDILSSRPGKIFCLPKKILWIFVKVSVPKLNSHPTSCPRRGKPFNWSKRGEDHQWYHSQGGRPILEYSLS